MAGSSSTATPRSRPPCRTCAAIGSISIPRRCMAACLPQRCSTMPKPSRWLSCKPVRRSHCHGCAFFLCHDATIRRISALRGGLPRRRSGQRANRLSCLPIRWGAGRLTKHRGAGLPKRRVALGHPSPAKRMPVRLEKERPAGPHRAGKAPTRSLAMRLAAEVERLAAQLEQSRARVSDLEAMIEIDPLTELLNRRGFERELKRALAYVGRYGASAALLFIDLDAFKPVNDRHGHAAGDAVLKAVAATLNRHVRASDVVARHGGDEFVVLLWNVTAAAAAAKAAVLETMIAAAPVRWGAATLTVGASAGVAQIGVADTATDLLARADAAMYARKRE